MLFAPILRSAAAAADGVRPESPATFAGSRVKKSERRCDVCMCWRTSWPLILSQPPPPSPALPSHLPRRQFPLPSLLPSVICPTPQEHKEQSIHRPINIREKRARSTRFARQTLLPSSLPLFLSPPRSLTSPAFIPPFTNREKSRQSRSSEQEEKAAQ